MPYAGTVCVLSGELSRYASFVKSLRRLQLPEGTVVDFIIGKGIVAGLNDSLARFLAGDTEWWCVLADDHVFPDDLLIQLLARDVPIVAPLNVQRHKPFYPLLYASAREDGPPVHQYTWQHLEHHAGLYRLPTRDSCGSAGMLIQREVLERLGTADWFQDRPGVPYSEDLYFCERVRALGYNIYIDLDCRMGHTFVGTAIPVQNAEGEWLVALQVNDKSIAYVRY